MTNWRFKDDHIEEIGTEDPWYALTDGGYFKPERCLNDEAQIKKVKAAIEIVKSFIDAAYEAGVLEEC